MPKNARHSGFGRILRNPSKIVLIALNLVAYFLMLRWAVENINLGKLMEAFGQIPSWVLLGSLFINLLALVLCGTRMSLLLGKDFYTSFSIINIGYALNTLFPLRLGEPVKLYLSRKLFGVPLADIFAASVAEKLFDLVMTLLFVAVVLVFATAGLVQVSALLSVSALVLVGVVAVILFRRYVIQIVKLFPKGSRLRRIFIEVHKHSGDYRIGRILIVTTGIWILNILLVYFSFNTYLPELRIGILEAVALLMVMALAIAIPSAPASIGLFEAGVVAYLTQTHYVGKEAALVVASAFHLIISLPQLIVTAKILLGWSATSLIRKAEILHVE